MRTTIDLPEELFRRAKMTAASQGITLKQLVIEALRHRLVLHAPRVDSWRDIAGDLSDLRAETARIGRVIADEFETIDEDEL